MATQAVGTKAFAAKNFPSWGEIARIEKKSNPSVFPEFSSLLSADICQQAMIKWDVLCGFYARSENSFTSFCIAVAVVRYGMTTSLALKSSARKEIVVCTGSDALAPADKLATVKNGPAKGKSLHNSIILMARICGNTPSFTFPHKG